MVLGGFLLNSLGLLGVLLFSFSLFFNVGLAMVWLYLELAGLCLVPLFFSGGSLVSLSGLFYYIIFSGVSSCLILLGVLVPDCVFFLLCGFLMKFGVFPLWGWVYRVCCVSNWFVIWGISTILKISFLFFSFFLVLDHLSSLGVLLLCGVGCLILSSFFWLFVYNWKICWCHIMLSSSSVLIGLGSSGCSSGMVFGLFFVYLVWASCVLLYLSSLSDSFVLDGGLSAFLFSFLLLTLPFSFSIFYKICVCSSVFTCGFFLLVCWVVYSFSEQLYLFMCLTGLLSDKNGVLSFSFV